MNEQDIDTIELVNELLDIIAEHFPKVFESRRVEAELRDAISDALDRHLK